MELATSDDLTGKRAVVIVFTTDKGRKTVTFDLIHHYGVSLAQLTSNAIAAVLNAGFTITDTKTYVSI